MVNSNLWSLLQVSPRMISTIAVAVFAVFQILQRTSFFLEAWISIRQRRSYPVVYFWLPAWTYYQICAFIQCIRCICHISARWLSRSFWLITEFGATLENLFGRLDVFDYGHAKLHLQSLWKLNIGSVDNGLQGSGTGICAF